jgi:hypothetical protein
MSARAVLLALAAATALTACGVPIDAGAHFARDLDLSRGATFAWNQPADRAHGDPRLEGNAVFEQALHEAIEWHLALRGLHPTDASPAFLVHHHLTLAEHKYMQEVVDDAGQPQTESYAYEGGNVVVHLVEAASGETVWVGWAQANIEPALAGPDPMRRWVNAVVAEIFERWPQLPRSAE